MPVPIQPHLALCPYIIAIATIVLALAPRGFAAAQNGLVASYLFDGNPNDSTGSAHGTVIGAVLTSDRCGRENHAYLFNGSGSHIVASAGALPTGERTVSAWFYAESISNRPCLLGYGGGGGPPGTSYFMCLNASGQQAYHMSSHWGTNTLSYPYAEAPIGEWHHFAVTTQAGATRMYVDGVETASNANFVNNTIVAGTDLAIGVIVSPFGNAPYVDGNVGYFGGKLDDLRIYDRALSSAEIIELHQELSECSAPPQCPGAQDLFFEGFESYAENTDLCGQGGWTEAPHASPHLCETRTATASGLGSKASDGTIPVPTNELHLTFHALPQLAPSARTSLSFEVFAYSDLGGKRSAASGISFWQYGAHGAGWFISRPSIDDAPRWQFDARGITGDASSTWYAEEYAGVDVRMNAEVIIDAANLEVFGRLELETGWLESARYSITEPSISGILGVAIQHDYRAIADTIGTEIDDIRVGDDAICLSSTSSEGMVILAFSLAAIASAVLLRRSAGPEV